MDSMQETRDLWLGTVLDGRFRLEEQVGRGGSGTVYRAVQLNVDRPVAVKLLRGSDQPGLVQRFENEARIIASLRDPHTLKLVDFGCAAGGQLYLVTELLEGASLEDTLAERGPLAWRHTLEILRGASDALAEAHARGVVHRDLKPGNLFLERIGDVELLKVLDFGIARWTQAGVHTTEGVLRGTPGFMSPEHGRGEEVDGRADLYSLGAVAYQCLTGRPVFTAANTMGLLLKHQQEPPPGFATLTPPVEVPRVVEALVMRLLAKDPARRYPDARSLSRALDTLLEPATMLPVAAALTTPLSHGGTDTSVPTLVDSSASTLAIPSLGKTNLAQPLDSFVGREAELEALEQRVAAGERLITILGTGGTGKTRLSQHFGAAQLPHFEGGVWFCDLSEARYLAGALSAMGAALDVPLTRLDPEVQLGDAIQGRGRVLLILDNFEQVVEQAAPMVGRWLQRAPEAVCLVTSRVLLRIAAESPLYLDPLPIAEAMRLFYDRGATAHPGFVRGPANGPLVQEVVERLDCIALAVELAAARLRLLSLEQIRARLSQRFKLLQGQRRDQPARQTTLRGAIDWSWALLPAAEQATLAQLSVFRGGFTLEATEAVVDLAALDAEPLDTITTLVDSSLLRRLEPAEGHVRYRMLESVRDYAAEKLGEEAPAAQLRHARYYATFGTDAAIAALDQEGGVSQRRAVELERENLVTGTRTALAAEALETAARCALGAASIFELRGPFQEGAAILDEVCGRLSGPLRGRVLTRAACLAWKEGQVERAQAHYEEALTMHRAAGDREGEGRATGEFGLLQWEQGRVDAARAHLEQALSIHREVDDPRGEALALGSLGKLHLEQGRVDEALEHWERALALHRRIGCRHGEGVDLGNLAILHLRQGAFDDAATRSTQALAILRALGDRGGEGRVLVNLGLGHQAQGQLDEAVSHFEQALAIHREVGDRRTEGVVLGNLGSLLYRRGDLATAEQQICRAITICDAVYPMASGSCRGQLALIRGRQGRLDEARALLTKGESQLRGVHAFELAVLLCNRALVEHGAGGLGAATGALHEAETIATTLDAATDSELGRSISEARSTLHPE